MKLGNGTRSSDWRGAAAIILALGVAASALALAVGDAARASPTPPETATILSTVLGASVGALAGYLGARAQSPPNAEDDDEAGE